MKTFIFVEKNGSGTLTISAESKDDAYIELGEIVKSAEDWRLDESLDEDESINEMLIKLEDEQEEWL